MKPLWILAFSCLMSFQVTAQKIYHSVGLGVEGYTYQNFSDKNYLVAVCLHYYPRVNVLSFNNSAISIGAPVTVGYAWVGFINEKYSFIYKLPLALDFNFGRNSSSLKESRFGGFFGVGYEWSQIFSKNIYHKNSHWFYSPALRAGLRTPFKANRGLTFSTQCRFGAEWPSKHTAVQLVVAYDF